LALPFEAMAWDFALLAIMGVVQLGIGCLLMLAAAPRLKAAEIGLLAVLEIVFGTLSTWWLVGERPGRLALIGGLVVISALIVNELIAVRGRPARRSDETPAATQLGH
jgi:drug/metabolite transporter (DMT)-like permease